MTPVIIEAAINGVANKARNPHVPCEPAEIAADALACLAAGAAIVHNHIDQFGSAAPAAAARYLEGWRPVLARRPDAILYPTVGFGGDVVERYAHIPPLAAAGAIRMSLFDSGSVNLGTIGDDGLPGGGVDFVYANSFGDVRHMAALCERHRLGPSVAVFEPGFLRTVLAYWRAGKLPRGTFVKLYFGGDYDYLGGGRRGVSFGLPPTPTALAAYLELLGDCDVPWAVAVIGGDVVASGMARLALERGGHLRVGLEDYAGARQPANVELVEEAAALVRAIGREPASTTQTASILGLPG
ncbi:3-keto-5-aminohexanoate cleavage protein [bacterium]|nr:3-keto-5-aminohexanoate cleavage protein [bacterium]